MMRTAILSRTTRTSPRATSRSFTYTFTGSPTRLLSPTIDPEPSLSTSWTFILEWPSSTRTWTSTSPRKSMPESARVPAGAAASGSNIIGETFGGA